MELGTIQNPADPNIAFKKDIGQSASDHLEENLLHMHLI